MKILTKLALAAPVGGERILTLPPADDSIFLSSFGGEGRGEEAATPGSRSALVCHRVCAPLPSPTGG